MVSLKLKAAIIGGGVVGVTTAAYLLDDGYEVTLFDPLGIGESTSCGNAGAFAYADIFPINQPSILLKAPKWFLDPLGPLTIPITYLPKILPWLTRFVWACRPGQVKRSVETMTQLMALSREQAVLFWSRWGLDSLVVHRGSLSVYENRTEFERAKKQWQLAVDQGDKIEFLSGRQIQALEPGIDRRFKYAVHVLDWPTVTDPKVYTKMIGEKILSQGGHLIEQRVDDLAVNPDGLVKIVSNGVDYQFDKLVLAGGAWSDKLSKKLGDNIPLGTERGYNTTLPEPGIELKHMVLFPEHAFVATPMSCGLRVGGANELAGTDHPPNYKRAVFLLEKAKKFINGIDEQNAIQWMGCRPSLPDSQPVIDFSSASKNVVYAFGHGHYGLTQSAATAKLVTQLLKNKKTSIDIYALRRDRF